LTNPLGEEQLVPPSRPADAPPKDTSSEPGKERKPVALEPGEIVSKNDFQVNQALNLLKGLQIMQGR
jgi:carboxyl-terminal processing protease